MIVTILYSPNNRVPNYMKQKQTYMKGKKIPGDFSIQLTIMNRTIIHKIEIVDLKTML